MPLRFTGFRRVSLASLLFVVAAGAGCAAHGSEGGEAPDAGSGDDEDTGPGVPSTFDSGPPATVGGGGKDAGPDTADAAANADSGTVGGPCTNASDCPGAGKANASVACNSGVCVFACNGENYDVNHDPTDGCEVPDQCPSVNGTAVCPIDNHTNALATNGGSYPCNDSSSPQDLEGFVPSDARDHTPAIDGFDTTTGGAPDYFKITGTGGACDNDANLTLQMDSPTKQSGCYELHLLTNQNKGGQTCVSDLTGSCSITNGPGSYGDNSTLYVWVQKTSACSGAQFPDDAHFHISGHL